MCEVNDNLNDLVKSVTLTDDNSKLLNNDADEPLTKPAPSANVKQVLRERIWDLMKYHHFTHNYPPSPHNKIPNFKYCKVAANKFTQLREYKNAKCVKINPSLAQMHLRYLTLLDRKQLLVPNPALEKGFFYFLDGKNLTETQCRKGCSKLGASKLGNALTKDSKIKIDIVVVGCVVCTLQGVRLGKGGGYGELEWAMLYEMGAVDENTLVATTVHDCQIISSIDLPVSLMSSHDLPVDIIVTPTRVMRVKNPLPKPTTGILWDLITDQMMQDMPILQQFKP